DLSEMEILAQVNEVDGPKLSIGTPCEVKLDSYPDMVITGAVKEISQNAIKASWMAKARIFRVIISLDKTLTEIMKPGMSAQVSASLKETSQQLLVPRPTVFFDKVGTKVIRFDPRNGRQERAVTILGADPFNYAIADNGALKEGDRILSK